MRRNNEVELEDTVATVDILRRIRIDFGLPVFLSVIAIRQIFICDNNTFLRDISRMYNQVHRDNGVAADSVLIRTGPAVIHAEELFFLTLTYLARVLLTVRALEVNRYLEDRVATMYRIQRVPINTRLGDIHLMQP